MEVDFDTHLKSIRHNFVSNQLCNESTGHRFKMADEQPSCNCWFSSQQSVYMASNAKKKCKNWLHIIKKHLRRGNFFYCFWICFTVSENIPLFLSLNRFMLQSTCKLVYHIVFLSLFFPFSFICVQIEREILSQKFSVTDCFPLSLDTEPKKCYWWNLKS